MENNASMFNNSAAGKQSLSSFSHQQQQQQQTFNQNSFLNAFGGEQGAGNSNIQNAGFTSNFVPQGSISMGSEQIHFQNNQNISGLFPQNLYQGQAQGFSSQQQQQQQQQLLFRQQQQENSGYPIMNDWKAQTTAQDRSAVIRQFGVAVQSALPFNSQVAVKIENLARGLEQHIFDSADSVENYHNRIADQLSNIERKASEVRITPTLAEEDIAFNFKPQDQNPKNILSLDTESHMATPTNSLGLDITGNNSVTSEAPPASVKAAPTPPTRTCSPLEEVVHGEGQISKKETENVESERNDNIPNQEFEKQNLSFEPSTGNENKVKVTEGVSGESQVNGMKVTLLDLSDSEKEGVQLLMEKIRPIFNNIEGLIQNLLNQGGDREFDKVRKLTGMKQMLRAQFDVLQQDIYFIRPETLHQLLPSLSQYFNYAELLASRNGGGMVQQRTGSPMMHQQQFRQAGASSPHMAQNMKKSPNARQGMVMNPQMQQARPQMQQQFQQQQQMNFTPQQIQQQVHLIQSKLMNVQQQKQQLQQMSISGAVSQEQMQRLGAKQQELLRFQQMLNGQLAQLSQMHSMVLHRMTMEGRNNMQMGGNFVNQQQNAMSNIRPQQMTPQMYAQRQAQIMAQNQIGAFQGQGRPQVQMTPQQQQQLAQNFQTKNGFTHTSSQSFSSDYHGSPGSYPPQSALSPAASTVVATPLSTKQEYSPQDNRPAISGHRSNASSNHASPANSGHPMQPLTPHQTPAMQAPFNPRQSNNTVNQPNNFNQNSLQNAPVQQEQNAQASSVLQAKPGQQPDTFGGDTKQAKTQWGDDAFNFGGGDAPLSALVPPEQETKEEDVEDFFNWDYEPEPAEGTDSKKSELDANTEAAQAELKLDDNTIINTEETQLLKRAREDDVDEHSPKKRKESGATLEETLEGNI